MNEPLLTVTKLFKKWTDLEKNGGTKPLSISRTTLYRLIRAGKIEAHGFGTPLVYESEVIESFKRSKYRNLKVIHGNSHLGQEKKTVSAELDRRIKEARAVP